jgi:hypothetical protein
MLFRKVLAFTCAALFFFTSGNALAQNSSLRRTLLNCNEREGVLCAEKLASPSYEYVGHDEPSLIFYSNRLGAGYNNVYHLRLPKDPPLLPKQNGRGGTWNFQLRPAFWFGMAMCDDQSAPNPGGSPIAGPNILCTPASDANIYDSPHASNPRYIGKHPGVAFTELQFYPPGWFFGNSTTQWTAALNIDSDSENQNTGQGNNQACGGAIEYVNFAFIQTDGIPFPPGSPSPLGPLVSTNANTLFMNPGDELIVTLADTPHGLKTTVQDLTTGQTGFMVSSAANGFAEILFDPNGTNCDSATHNIPYDFHPMYSTSSEHTRVTWTAHSYNIAFSDEIGHFEYCDSVPEEGGPCASTKHSDPPGIDDEFCLSADLAASLGLLPIGGCLDGDADFDGVPYRRTTWPGTFRNPKVDAKFHSEPVIFSSPLLIDPQGRARNFSRVAFEADLPRIEDQTHPPCQRHLSNPSDPNPGQGCVNPPVGADFYPIYTTRLDSHQCSWQLGGTFIPGTDQTFGGNSKVEYGPIQASFYPAPNGISQYILENFHRTLPFNPCPVRNGSSDE